MAQVTEGGMGIRRAGSTARAKDQAKDPEAPSLLPVDVREAGDRDLGADADPYTRHFRDRSAYERMETLLSDGSV